MTGPIARQGPHHSAQKSTTVSLSEEITLSWKLVSVNSNAMIELFLCYMIVFARTNILLIRYLFGRLPDIPFFASLDPSKHKISGSKAMPRSKRDNLYVQFRRFLQKSGHFFIHLKAIPRCIKTHLGMRLRLQYVELQRRLARILFNVSFQELNQLFIDKPGLHIHNDLLGQDRL